MPRYRDIEYHLRQSKRKTMSIYIEPDGSVSVLTPESLSMEEIEKVIEGKRYWIYSKMHDAPPHGHRLHRSPRTIPPVLPPPHT